MPHLYLRSKSTPVRRCSSKASLTLQKLIEEFQRLENLKEDSTLVEQPSSSKQAVHAVQEKQSGSHQQRPTKKEDNGKLPRTPCWQCGQMHFIRDCPFSDHLCKACNRVGHKEGYCNCISKSSNSSSKADQPAEGGKMKQQKAQSRGIFVVNHVAANHSRCKFLPININGVATQLQLDTASDITVVSKGTWRKLGRPCLQPASIQAINASDQPVNRRVSV